MKKKSLTVLLWSNGKSKVCSLLTTYLRSDEVKILVSLY